MRILAIDTTTEACTVGLLNNGLTDTLSEIRPQQHAAMVLPMVEQLLLKHQLSLAELDAIAVTVGPGSFTGIRIGVSVVQGLAFAAAKPVIPISTLAVLAQGAYRKTGLSHVIAGIDARMGEIYWGEYCFSSEIAQAQILDTEQLIQPAIAAQKIQQCQQYNWAYAGSAWSSYCLAELSANKLAVASQIVLPEAQDLVTLAEYSWHNGQVIAAQHLEPVYLRDNVAHKAKS